MGSRREGRPRKCLGSREGKLRECEDPECYCNRFHEMSNHPLPSAAEMRRSTNAGPIKRLESAGVEVVRPTPDLRDARAKLDKFRGQMAEIEGLVAERDADRAMSVAFGKKLLEADAAHAALEAQLEETEADRDALSIELEGTPCSETPGLRAAYAAAVEALERTAEALCEASGPEKFKRRTDRESWKDPEHCDIYCQALALAGKAVQRGR